MIGEWQSRYYWGTTGAKWTGDERGLGTIKVKGKDGFLIPDQQILILKSKCQLQFSLSPFLTFVLRLLRFSTWGTVSYLKTYIYIFIKIIFIINLANHHWILLFLYRTHNNGFHFKVYFMDQSSPFGLEIMPLLNFSPDLIFQFSSEEKK